MNEDLVLHHVAIHDKGAFGVLLYKNMPFAVSLERTFGDDEQSFYTVIPPGRFLCTKTVYHKYGYETFEIHIPGHTRILFHKLNTEDQSLGCIGIGEEFGELNGQPAILQSGKGFKEFMVKFGDRDSFYLTVN